MSRTRRKSGPKTPGSGKACSIKLHSARSSEGRVLWPELHVEGSAIEDIDSLKRELGQNARIEWALISGSGVRSVVFDDDPRIEDGGFLLRIPEREARSGVRAECALVIDEEQERQHTARKEAQ